MSIFWRQQYTGWKNRLANITHIFVRADCIADTFSYFCENPWRKKNEVVGKKKLSVSIFLLPAGIGWVNTNCEWMEIQIWISVSIVIEFWIWISISFFCNGKLMMWQWKTDSVGWQGRKSNNDYDNVNDIAIVVLWQPSCCQPWFFNHGMRACRVVGCMLHSLQMNIFVGLQLGDA